jgi:flagellin
MASFSVVNNIASANAQANLEGTNTSLTRALNRLSSGFRINYSGDDAAGLAVANGYRSEVAVLNQGIRNANDALSKLQIKDRALDNISHLLDRLATLGTQAATSTADSTQRATLNNEFQDVLSEISREAAVANLDSDVAFSIFVSSDETNGVVSGSVSAITTTSLQLNGLALTSQASAATAVATIASAVISLGRVQGQIGTLENRLEFAIGLARSQAVNIKAAESRIRDANVAEEAANMTRFSILNQSGIAALAQANQSTSAVLSLLR